VFQPDGYNWGEMVQPTPASPIDDAGYFASWYAGNPGGSAYNGPAVAYLGRRVVGSELVDRWLMLTDASGINHDALVVETGTTVTGADNNTVGTRTVGFRGGSAGTARLLDILDDGLVGGTPRDMAVRPDPDAPPAESFFDVYFLTDDGATTKLAGVRADIPADGPMSWEAIDLDPNSANTWLQLKDAVEDVDIAGRGIVFSADGNLLYVSSTLNLSTGHGGSAGTDDARVYLFDIPAAAGPIPEPAGLGLLGLALLAARRRRS
jgi:MYXO-CTERM domain-containing protein